MASTRVKILCVDDQPANLTALEALLRTESREVIGASSGSEAVELATRHDFAVILLDVQMPVLDGFGTARRIRGIDRARTTPIIFLTANYPDEKHLLRGYEAGAVDYLFKPLNTTVLQAKVDVFIELYEKNRELLHQRELLRQAESREQERKLAELRHTSERRYRNLVEGIRDGIVWAARLNPPEITFVSQRIQSILGYSADQWLSDPELARRTSHPEDEGKVAAAVALLQHRDSVGYEHRLFSATGEELWFHTEMHLESGADPGRPEIRGLSVNITGLKKTEDTLRAAVRIREDFLAVASHELRTPITPLQLQLQGFIHLIETGRIENLTPDRLKEMLEMSDAQVNRLIRLIGQLLDVSRINAGRFVMEREEVDLAHLVEDVLFQLRHEIMNSECAVELRLEPGVRGHWDPHRIEQVLVNLLTNATKYGSGRKIQITVRRVGDGAELGVRDEGIGIAVEDQHRIFDRFERAVSAKHFGGLGLGLYITRQIVELHQGRITVESEAGRGAHFKVEIPLGLAVSCETNEKGAG